MEQRVKFVVLAEANRQSFASLCKDFGISRKTGYKWLSRKRERGIGGLKEMSRRPLSNKRSIAERVIKVSVREVASYAWASGCAMIEPVL